ncbi:MAG TPA: SDR family oxidoreductase [Chloroflexota bacterium]|nr:SDR family oxidoreductase [Chloroflexota bacterium]
MAERLAGRVALVTGGGGGIGEATARLFFEEGARVALVDNDGGAARRAAEAIDPRLEGVLPIAADLAKEPEAERAVRETAAHFGRLDALANVAGVRVWGPITDATPESWDFILDVNLKAVAYCSKFAVPEMVKQGGGSIVNVSSANAIVGRRGMAQYDASKAAVLALTRSMACDHAAQGIRVNAVCPGPTLTMFHVRRRAAAKGISLAEAEAEMRAAGASGPLLKRQAEPREIAYGILYLACDESSYVTGTTLMVDGGLSV